MMPSGDQQVQEMINLFEKTVYEQSAIWRLSSP